MNGGGIVSNGIGIVLECQNVHYILDRQRFTLKKFPNKVFEDLETIESAAPESEQILVDYHQQSCLCGSWGSRQNRSFCSCDILDLRVKRLLATCGRGDGFKFFHKFLLHTDKIKIVVES